MDPVENQLRIYRDMGFGFLEAADLGQAPAVPARTEGAAAPAEDVKKPARAEQPSLPGFVDDVRATRPHWMDQEPLPLAERVEALQRVAEQIAACQECRLCHSRMNTVPGEGNPEAELMFVGEGPGMNEDKQGRPFVGPAGELLTKIIKAMQFEREEIYIANVVKCRPPGNRVPEADEMEKCLPYLSKQLEIIRPRVIVALGKTAVTGLLPEHRPTPVSKLRGRWLSWHGVPVMPTFHPAYLLRDSRRKKDVWADMQEVMKVFNKTSEK